jgi:hypothetical protein
MAVAIVERLEVVDIDQHHRDREPIAGRLLPQPARLLFERVTVEQSGESVVHRDFGETPAIEEGDAVGVLQGVAACPTDQVGAEQDEKLVGRDVRRHMPGGEGDAVGSDDDHVGAQGRMKRHRQHEVHEEDGQHEPGSDQRHLFAGGLGGQQHGSDAEQRCGRLDAELVPAVEEVVHRQDQHHHHHRQLQPEAHQVGVADARVRQNPMIDEGKAERRGQGQQQAHARPAAVRVAVGRTEFGFELVGETEPQQAAAGRMRNGRNAVHTSLWVHGASSPARAAK